MATKYAGDGVNTRQALMVLVLFSCGRSGARYAFSALFSFFLVSMCSARLDSGKGGV